MIPLHWQFGWKLAIRWYLIRLGIIKPVHTLEFLSHLIPAAGAATQPSAPPPSPLSQNVKFSPTLGANELLRVMMLVPCPWST
jgi:hypothetical protein